MLSSTDLDFISNVPIFGAMSPEALQRIGSLARRMDLEQAGPIFNEGEPAKEMVVVLAGELEVRKRGRSGAEAVIATLHPGDVAGEMSLIDIQPRSAGVFSIGPAAMAVLSHNDLATFYREDPGSYTILVLNIAREISRRLRRVDLLLADILVDLNEVWLEANRSITPARKS
jgi:CRP/FNR family transcriptional regulator, cyclic AMP receptor protein